VRRWLRTGLFIGLAAALAVSCNRSKAQQAKDSFFTSPESAGPDFIIQGEYIGETTGKGKIGAQVIAEGDGTFVVHLLSGGLPGEGWDRKSIVTASARTADGKTTVQADGMTGDIANGKLNVVTTEGAVLTLTRVERKSPTLGAKAPPGALVLFDGSTAEEWTGGQLVEGHLLNNGVTSKRSFQDFTLHLEFRLPFMPKARGQGRANSGVYVQNRWEIQLLDSFAGTTNDNECGAVYSQFKPLIQMSYPPLSWQTYDIDFQAARFAGKQKVADAMLTVTHNGVTIQDHVKLSKGPSPGGQNEEPTGGPIHLQNHGTPVYFRNVWILEKK
jgi:hypothetical protein